MLEVSCIPRLVLHSLRYTNLSEARTRGAKGKQTSAVPVVYVGSVQIHTTT